MKEIERGNACLITAIAAAAFAAAFLICWLMGWIFAGFAQGARRVQANGLIRVFWLLDARQV
jgi:hypothetical protein